MKKYRKFAEEYMKIKSDYEKKIYDLRNELLNDIKERFEYLDTDLLKFFNKNSTDCYYDDNIKNQLGRCWVSMYDSREDEEEYSPIAFMWVTEGHDTMVENDNERTCLLYQIQDIKELENILKHLLILTPEQIKKQEEWEEIHGESEKYNI